MERAVSKSGCGAEDEKRDHKKDWLAPWTGTYAPVIKTNAKICPYY
jgi:hypothetical protein